MFTIVGRKKRGTITPRRAAGTASLSFTLVLDRDAPPAEFRIFKAGVNDSEKGSFLFDEKAAAMVMAAFQKHGVDRMVDLEHLSIDPDAPNFDPDARAWFRLELRDGELWAVDVKWTPDGVRRLTEKTQRFISPTFTFDRDGRITKLFNIALTAMPATHGTPELVAARVELDPKQTRKLAGMLPTDLVMQAIEALAEGNAEAAMNILKQVIAAAAGATAEEAPPAEEAPAEGEELAGTEEESLQDEEEETVAATAKLREITGKATLAEAVEDIAAWRKSHLSLEANREKTEADRAALDAEEYRQLTTKLVKLGIEIPATAWELDEKGLPTSTPCKRILSEPLTSLRTRVTLLSAGRKPIDAHNPKPKASGNEHGLTDEQLAICKEMGCDPATFAALNAVN